MSDAEADRIQIARDGPVMEIRMNRPDKKNALTPGMYAALADALKAAGGDPAVRAVVIGSRGDVFTAGNDLQDFAARPPVGSDASVNVFLQAIAAAAKPIVAAVGGAAIGVGVTMLLHCDLVVAARAARFQMPFVDLALVPEAASSLLLPRLVGLHRASELLILGERIDAEEAHRLGLVNRLADDADGAHALAMRLAQRIAAKPPEAVRLTRALIRLPEETVAARMAVESGHFGERLQSPEAKEAFAAFLERRAPDFTRFG